MRANTEYGIRLGNILQKNAKFFKKKIKMFIFFSRSKLQIFMYNGHVDVIQKHFMSSKRPEIQKQRKTNKHKIIII